MAKPTVYLETSIISYLTARATNDVVAAGRQALAKQWWDTRRTMFELVTSQTVIDEAALGDSEAAARRLNLLVNIPLVSGSSASAALAEALLRRMSLPSHVAADAAHIAVAAANGIEYLLTWN